MRVLLVLAHPRRDSYNAAIAATIRETLEAAGHAVDWCDLYAEGFDPVLSAEEAAAHRGASAAPGETHDDTARLLAAHALVMVFPQWWFNVPAILKGWFDRVLVPGAAFDRVAGKPGLRRRLTNIRCLWCVTTTGSPGWVVRFIARNPVKRQLRLGIGLICAKDLSFRVIGHYGVDRSDAAERARFLDRLRVRFGRF